MHSAAFSCAPRQGAMCSMGWNASSDQYVLITMSCTTMFVSQSAVALFLIFPRAKTTGRFFVALVTTAFGLNVVAGDQYIALVPPSCLYGLEFRKRGLQPQNLSRSCADGGAVTSALVPRNSCGAYMAATLGVATLACLPFAIFNIASPLLSMLWGITGFKIERTQPPRGDVPDARPV